MLLRYSLAWFALMVIAIVNGTVREFTYGRRVSELTAHQVSTVTGIFLTGAFVWFLNRVWPIETGSQAWAIGAIWLLMTIVFENGFGHFIAGHSWTRLLADYNLMAGRIWVLFLLWVLMMPSVVRWLVNR
jgi:hypothetical protein